MIYIGADHKGFNLAASLEDNLLKNGYNVENLSKEVDPNNDYVDEAVKLTSKMTNQDLGILICGTGIGMSIAANKVKGIRAAKCDNTLEAKLCKEHNNANVICFSSSKSIEEIFEMTKIFLSTPFSDEERHIRRVAKIINLER